MSKQPSAPPYPAKLDERGVRLFQEHRSGYSSDNALAKSVIGRFKTGVIKLRGPGKSMVQVEGQTLKSVAGTTATGYTAPSDTAPRTWQRRPFTQIRTSMTKPPEI